MKVLQIEVSNYRLIKAMLLELDGKNLAVAGNAGQGKTTAISVLWEALTMVGDPVTHGERKGQIKITLGDGDREVFVTRSFTAKTAPITILTSKGEKVSAAEFASWFCDLGQNPHKILDMKPKEQTAALLEAVKLPEGVDLKKLDAERAEAAQKRLELQRDGKRDAEALGAEPPKANRVNLESLAQEEAKAEQANEARNLAEQSLRARAFELAGFDKDAQRLEEEIAALKDEIKEREECAANLAKQTEATKKDIEFEEKTIAAMPEAVDVRAIREKIQKANDANRDADRWEDWGKRRAALDGLRAEYKRQDARVKALDATKAKALHDAVWPVDGMSIEDGEVKRNGTPLSQCGHSEQMLICGALAAETISRHKLKVVRMDGIESMSPDDFKSLEKIFNEKGIQVFSSRVSRGDVEEGEIEIVEGEIK